MAEAQALDMDRAVTAAREAFDKGPWPRMSHQERAGYLRAIAEGLAARVDDYNEIWPRESGVVHTIAQYLGQYGPDMFNLYAGLADTYPFEEVVTPTPSPLPGGDFGLLCREPVGVVGAIIPWNGPLQLIVPDPPSIGTGTYPNVLTPAFVVPASILLHVLSLRQLRRRSRTEVTRR